MKLLSIDPGKHTGWAAWESGDGHPTLLMMGVTETEKELYKLLSDILDSGFRYDQLVVEDYKIRPKELTHGYAHQWNSGVALQVIGAVELYSTITNTPVHRQPASVLPVGCGYIGYSYRKGIHVPNNVSAIAHGAYWLVKNKYADSKGFKTVTA
jgi:hypothetical protein